MKKILLFLIYSIASAQSLIVSEDNLNLHSNKLNDFDQIAPLPTTLLEMKLDRSFLRDSAAQSNYRDINSTIRFKGPRENFIDSDLFIIAVSSAVAFGAAAAYFKLESDNYYDKYLATKNKSYKNRTDRYDLYSGIALGVMEINFGFLVYKFLTD